LTRFGLGCEPDRAGRKKNAEQNRIEAGYTEAAGPAQPSAIAALTARRQRLSRGKRREQRKESAQSD
jgi:hypothetical protein